MSRSVYRFSEGEMHLSGDDLHESQMRNSSLLILDLPRTLLRLDGKLSIQRYLSHLQQHRGNVVFIFSTGHKCMTANYQGCVNLCELQCDFCRVCEMHYSLYAHNHYFVKNIIKKKIKDTNLLHKNV